MRTYTYSPQELLLKPVAPSWTPDNYDSLTEYHLDLEIFKTSTPIPCDVSTREVWKEGQKVTEDMFRIEEQFWTGSAWWPTFHLVDGKVKPGTKTRTIAFPIIKQVNMDQQQWQEMNQVERYKWVFETNGHKWLNNDNTAGDNFGSYRQGYRDALATSQPGDDWVRVEGTNYPPHNLGVLVFIPEEDYHVTSGMWDIDNKWVLLDEYRVPECEVTHWKFSPDIPEPYKTEREKGEQVMEELRKMAKETPGLFKKPSHTQTITV